MKDRRTIKGVSSPKLSTNDRPDLNGVRAVMIRKNSVQYQILRRLREYHLYAKLRSLLPPQTSQVASPIDVTEEAIEVELEPDEKFPKSDDEEFPKSDDEESGNAPTLSVAAPYEANMQEHSRECNVVYDCEHDGEVTSEPYVPSIKIKSMSGSILINAIVFKRVSLASTLFRILEDENLDVVFENQYRTENKVVHIILVKVQPDYKVHELEKKLCSWAGRCT